MAKKRGVLGFWYFLFTILIYARISFSARSDKEMRERFYGNLLNSSTPNTNDTIAKMFDRVLEKEFAENDQPEGLSLVLEVYFSYILVFLSYVW